MATIADSLTPGSAEGFTECTPKAVENRLYSWKKKNVSAATNPSAAAAGAAAPETPKKTAARARKDPATPKTPRAKKAAAAKKAGSEDEEQEKEGKAGGKKRGGDEGEGEGIVKKMKLEEVDGEEGMGLDGGADGDAEVKEEE